MSTRAGQSADGARALGLEVRLHDASPFPPLINGVLVFALLYGSYILVALQVGQAIIETGPSGDVRVNSGSWAAFVLSLIFSAAVTIPAFSARQWRASIEDLATTLDEVGTAQVHAISRGSLRSRLGGALGAFGLGAAGGLAFNVWLLQSSGLPLATYLMSTGGWYAVVSPILFGLGARSISQLQSDDRDMAALVTGHLKVRPGEFDRLEVYGQLALRSAFAWIVMAAIILLFFVYTAPVFISFGTLALSLLASAYAFTSTIRPVVRAATEIRARALEEVRAALDAEAQAALARATGTGSKPRSEPGALSDLIAYESWLAARPVWPISAPITRRLALYGLIPVLAWFGAAAAEVLLERLT